MAVDYMNLTEGETEVLRQAQANAQEQHERDEARIIDLEADADDLRKLVKDLLEACSGYDKAATVLLTDGVYRESMDGLKVAQRNAQAVVAQAEKALKEN